MANRAREASWRYLPKMGVRWFKVGCYYTHGLRADKPATACFNSRFVHKDEIFGFCQNFRHVAPVSGEKSFYIFAMGKGLLYITLAMAFSTSMPAVWRTVFR